MLDSPNQSNQKFNNFQYMFEEHIERIFSYFLHPETINNHEHSSNPLFKVTLIQTQPTKIYHITLDSFQNDLIEIETVQIFQDSNYSSLTNIVTKLNEQTLLHPIWIELKFFFNSCANNTLLIFENKLEESEAKLPNVLQEFISTKRLLKICEQIKRYLFRLNKNIIHTESVLILRPLSQTWKCMKTLEFWKQIYKEDKYIYNKEEPNEQNEIFRVINKKTNTETTYKIKEKVLLQDRILLRLSKESNNKNSNKKYLSISILSISPITCFITVETEIFSSVNLDFLCCLSQYQQCFLKNLKRKIEKLPCES